MRLFPVVGLVDADGVDPERSRFGFPAEVLQRSQEIVRDREYLVVVDKNSILVGLITPHV